MDIDFYSQYININFDEILMENNNPLVNSEGLYLTFKRNYFDETFKNQTLFNTYSKKLNELEIDNGHTVNNTRHFYVYKDNAKIESLQALIKNIVISQNTLLYNFHHYVTLLNSNQEIFQTDNDNKYDKTSCNSSMF